MATDNKRRFRLKELRKMSDYQLRVFLSFSRNGWTSLDLLFTDKLMWMARDPTIGRHLVEQVIKICTKSHK